MSGLAKLSAQLASVLSTWMSAVRTASLEALDSPRLMMVDNVGETLVHFLFVAGIAAEEKIVHVEAIQHDLVAHGFDGA